MATIAFRSSTTKSSFSLYALLGAVAAWNDARVTRASLSRLTAHELADIGIARSDIENIAKGNLIR